jgi:hypothetical protein
MEVTDRGKRSSLLWLVIKEVGLWQLVDQLTNDPKFKCSNLATPVGTGGGVGAGGIAGERKKKLQAVIIVLPGIPH